LKKKNVQKIPAKRDKNASKGEKQENTIKVKKKYPLLKARSAYRVYSRVRERTV